MNSLSVTLALAIACILCSCRDVSGPEWDNVVIAHPLVMNLASEQHLTLNGSDSSYSESVTAYFRNPAGGDTGHAVPVGGVLLNGSAIPRRDGNVYADSARAATLPLLRGLGYNRWHVDGLGAIPTFSDSISSPASFLRMRSPAPTDTIRLSHGLLLAWDTVGRPASAQAALVITGMVRRGTDSSITTLGYILADNGAFAIAPEGLAAQGWIPGSATILLQRYLNRDTLAPGRVRYRIAEIQTIEMHTTFAR
ncbi:MAG TPA: hypothetical protein VHI13_02685 [Candidatus Kapabacteria bacterium]|nr:hypothetical protein [Candidatus Kapabacteria bacterium]